MKKIFYLLILVLISTTSIGQVIDWGPTTKLEERISNTLMGVSGKYLGQIDDYDYFTYFVNSNSFGFNNDIQFSFLKVKNNETVLFTPYTEKSYAYFNVLLIENQIAIIYSEKENDQSSAIKIDYYDPDDLKFRNTELLFTYFHTNSFRKESAFCISEDNTFFGIFTSAKNPETNNNSFLIKTFNLKLQEYSETYLILNDDFYNTINCFSINNDGTGFVACSEFNTNEIPYVLKRIKIYKFGTKNDQLIEFQMNSMNQIKDLHIVQIADQKVKMLLIEEENLKIFDLDFENEWFSNDLTFKINQGNWKFDKILKLDNGNYVIAIADKEIETYSDMNNRVSHTLINKDIQFFCFDKDLNNKIYSICLGRYFRLNENYLSPKGNLCVSPLYYQKNNTVTLLYSSKIQLPKQQPLNGLNDYYKWKREKNSPCFYQKSTINENGEIITLTLSDYKTEKGLFNTGFCHLNNEETITISKISNKNITFGTIFQ